MNYGAMSAFLLNLCIQSALLVVGAYVLILIFRIRDSITRYGIWLSVLIGYGALMLFLIIKPLPTFSLSFTSSPRMETGGIGRMEDSPEASLSVSTEPRPVVDAKPDHLPTTKQVEHKQGLPFDVYLVLALLWLSGVLWQLVRFIRGSYLLHRLSRRSLQISDARIRSLVGEIAGEIGLKRRVTLRSSSEIQGPVSLGFFKPVIILPHTLAETLLEEELRMVIIHELAHIKRLDFAVNLLQSLLGIVLYFHPAFYLLKANLAKERESICDAWVVYLTGKRCAYARCLVNIREGTSRPIFSTAIFSRGENLKRRIKMLLDEGKDLKIHMPRSVLVIIVSFFLIVTVCVSTIHPVSSAARPEPEAAQSWNSLYTISYRGNLFRVDITAGSFDCVLIGDLGQPFNSDVARTEGLAMSPDGFLYASVNFADAESELYRINPQTAEATLVGSMGQKQVDGLGFAKDGTLYGVTSRGGLGGQGYGSKLIKMDIETGDMTLVIPELWLDDFDALAIDPDDMAIAADGVSHQFYQVGLTGELLLFSVDMETYQSDLNNGVISEGLQQEFKNNGFLLSDDASVSAKETDAGWLINNRDRTHGISKQDDELSTYYKDREVTAQSQRARQENITVLGGVIIPGEKSFPRSVSVVEAVAAAGGFSDAADPASARIIRRRRETIPADLRPLLDDPDDPSAKLLARLVSNIMERRREVIPVDLKVLLDDPDDTGATLLDDRFMLGDGDVLIIPSSVKDYADVSAKETDTASLNWSRTYSIRKQGDELNIYCESKYIGPHPVILVDEERARGIEGLAFGIDGYLYGTTDLMRPDVSYLIRIDPTKDFEYTNMGNLGFFVNCLAPAKP